MSPVPGRSRSNGYGSSGFNFFTGPTLGLLLLCIAGTHCWQWGSVRSCPPGEEPECPKNPLNDTVNYFAHPTDCHYYVQCDSNGKAICRRCSPTTYFNPHISNCVWPLDARCETNATTRQSSLLPPICVPDRDEEDGSLLLGEPCEDTSDCNYYYRNCTERTKCPDKQHYNNKTKRCENWCMAGCQNPLDIPDCRQCPREGEILNHECEKYMICTNGVPIQVKCKSSEHYDTATKTCVPGSCCEDKPDLKNCSFYITNCNERAQCPPNQHFNAKTKRCEDFCIAGCQSPWKIAQCRECQTDGDILQFDCHYYTKCVNGKPEQFKCKLNEHFDQTVGKCMPGSCCEDEPDPKDCSYYITNCDQRTRCPANQHFNKNTKHCENICTAGCQNPLDIPQCRQCKEGEILQSECQFYSICRNGKIEQVKCNINEQFDQNLKKCVPGFCCEDKPDPNDCGYYITNCNQRTPCPPNQHYNKNTRHCENICTAGCQNPLDIPQCRQCKEGEILQSECQFYSICRNGKIEQVKCNINEQFDQNLKKCVPGSCCEDKPDPSDCGYYITNCNQRTPCPPNQHYNKNTRHCENICTAGCQNPLDIPQCRQCKEGEILQSECQFYSTCRNGKIEQVKCNINEHFDQNLKKCVPGSCCEDKPDPNDCGYYITNCNQRTPCPPNQHYNKNTRHCENICTAGCQNPLEIPQCRQCPTDGQIIQYDCQFYTICKNGKPEKVTCKDNEHFDLTANKCLAGSCCEDKPDPNDCGYFITNCNQRFPCPPNQHYNKKTGRCENICTAGCQNPLEIPQCRQCQIEQEILQADCQYYTICRNGEPQQVKCNINEHFDMAAKKCVPGSCCEDKPDPNDCGYYITNCNQRMQCPPNQHYNQNTKRCENVCTAGCQNPLKIPQCRQCPVEGQILQYECQHYSICKNGKPEQVKCNINEHFDHTAQRCVPGSCCEDKPDPSDCGYYITNCNQRTPCPPNQHYNKNTRRCEDFCTAGCLNPLDIPQCRQCPREGEILQFDCQYYTICRNGVPEQIKCNINEHFDERVRKCIPGSCCEDQPDTNNCSFYITNCNQRVQCPHNQHFNKRTKKCEDACTAGCLNPSDIPQCRNCPEGKIMQSDCQYYVICRNNQPEQVKCNINEHFDQNAKKCVPGSCCEDKPDPNDCSAYITNCNQRAPCPLNQHFNKRTKKCEDACTAGCINPSDIPQCRNCPEGKILQSDCQYYVICRNNQPEQVKCNSHEHFDQNAKKCVPGPCCEDKPDPNDCAYYITNCNQRTPCPPNQHYNKVNKRCEDKCTAGCIDPKQLPECHGECQPEGKTFEDPCSCEMYYKCQNGKKVLAMCNQGLHYNSTLGRCDAPCGDVCVKLFARKPECCASTKGKPEPQCSATKLSVFLPHPSDSKWFYQCVDGVLYCNRCPPGHRWNIDADTCDESCQCP